MKLSFPMVAGLAVLVGAVISAPAMAESGNGQAGAQQSQDSFQIASGFDYSVGGYGYAADTTMWSIPIDLKAQLGRLRLQASLPYDFLKGPGQLVGGQIIVNPNSTATTSRSGIGDLNLSAAYRLTTDNGIIPTIEVGGSVKLPTAKSTIGTGQTDYSANVAMYKAIGKVTTLFGSVGYSWVGSPAAYQLENGLTASGGLNFRPVSNQNYGVSVAYREPYTIGRPGYAVVSPYMTYRFTRLLGLTLYGVAGLNNASPRLGAGLRITVFE